jgi:ketosteroid isomerase-like protein
MSQENVELVRNLFDATSSGDLEEQAAELIATLARG